MSERPPLIEKASARELFESSPVITHHFSTIQRAERIVVLQGGHIVESGRHAELLARGEPDAHL